MLGTYFMTALLLTMFYCIRPPVIDQRSNTWAMVSGTAYRPFVYRQLAPTAIGIMEKILPASQRNIESAQANYTSGKLDFLRLLDAERQLYSQREMYYQAIAEYHRRLAELERAVGETVR